MEINKGSYSAVKFGNGTNEALKAFNAEHSIPNALDPNKLHTTVLFSRKFLPNYVPAGRIDPPLVGKFIGYDVWLSAPFSGTRCLVMLYDCPELVKRHKDLMTEHGATYDFEEYKPHITISYDIGDYEVSGLPDFNETIEIVNEYGEDLDFGWINKLEEKNK